MRTQLFNFIFSEPGKSTLGHPCKQEVTWCFRVPTANPSSHLCPLADGEEPLCAVREFKAVSGEGGRLREREIDDGAPRRPQFPPDALTLLQCKYYRVNKRQSLTAGWHGIAHATYATSFDGRWTLNQIESQDVS